MNEQQWLSSTDPAAMMRFLTSDGDDGQGRFFASDRKMRLFACACVDLHHPADSAGGIGMRERHEAWLNNGGQPESGKLISEQWVSERKSKFFPEKAALLRDIFGNPFRPVVFCAQRGDCVTTDRSLMLPCDPILARQTGNPNEPCFFAQGRNSWLTPTVRDMAQAIYDARDWAATPVLADALEQAGCTNADILNHLRFGEGHYAHCFVCRCSRIGDACPHCVNGVYAESVKGKELACDACRATGVIQAGGGHVRGCWATDLLTGRQ